MADIKLYIFDMNGTLTNTPFVDKQPLHVLPGRKEDLATLKAEGAKLAIASNQGGVAFGFQTEQGARDEVKGIMEQLDIDYYRVAFGHPKPKYGYEEYGLDHHLRMRKPAPGMLKELIDQAGVTAEETLMVGDRDEDQEAAHAAGCLFCWAVDFFENREAQLFTVYQLFLKCVEVSEDPFLQLQINADGSSGQITQWPHGTIEWGKLYQAPQIIEHALKVFDQHRSQAVEVPASQAPIADDFDPFLDD